MKVSRGGVVQISLDQDSWFREFNNSEFMNSRFQELYIVAQNLTLVFDSGRLLFTLSTYAYFSDAQGPAIRDSRIPVNYTNQTKISQKLVGFHLQYLIPEYDTDAEGNVNEVPASFGLHFRECKGRLVVENPQEIIRIDRGAEKNNDNHPTV